MIGNIRVNAFPKPVFFLVIVAWLTLVRCGAAFPDDPEKRLATIGREVQKSVVQIAITDARGTEKSVGAGFAVDNPHWIVTNLHVIGEGRSFVVKDIDGKRLTVKRVLASDRLLDLAILEIAEDHLKPLPLEEEKNILQGESFVAIGHPQGLENSMVQGMISSRRLIEGRDMLQVAMPVEPGNSGGPIVNAKGRVLGTVTLKSSLSDNIGFAISAAQIRKLIANPNPVKLENWLKIGVLDSKSWKPILGSHWRKQGGRIIAHSAGEGLGGRTLCIYQKELPQIPFEISVEVKLEDESGAAGLCFLLDDQTRHYGFYPSNTRLRFSRFEGSTPFQWNVLQETPAVAYREGEWNLLRVRIEEDRIIGFVNGEKVVESTDRRVAGSKVGLAKFRNTVALFRNFQVASSLKPAALPEAAREALKLELTKKLGDEQITKILKQTADFPGPARKQILLKSAELERRAERLRQLADWVHLEDVRDEIKKLASGADDEIDMVRACMWIARVDDPDHEIDGYVEAFQVMADKLKKRTPADMPVQQKIEMLNRFLFKELGFHGSRHDYYRPQNSYLSNVLDDREGIPITLSILYMELARKIGLSADGIGLPGHFIVSINQPEKSPQLVDVFDGGKLITVEDAKFIVASNTTRNWDLDYLKPVSNRDILIRVLQNLRGIAERKQEPKSVLRYLELMHAIDPHDVSIKGARAVFLFQSGRQQTAIRQLDEIIEQRPTGLDMRMIQQIRRRFDAELTRQKESPNSN